LNITHDIFNPCGTEVVICDISFIKESG